MSRRRRIVVKVGTSTLTGADGLLDRAYLADLVAQIADLREKGSDVVLVSSGAIAAGLEAMGAVERPTDLTSLQAAAAVGQARIISAYGDLFAARDVRCAQVLLTRHDTTHRGQYLYACATLDKLLEMRVVPVVNENDTTAVEEIRFGDNDTLAALVAVMVEADLAIVLTDIEGLYDSHPEQEGAELLTRVEEITDDMVAAAGGPGSTNASGGMATKLAAAKILMKAGIPLAVVDGRRAGVVTAVASGESVGTYFVGEDDIGHRKLWIAFARQPKGTVVVDEGASSALRLRGKSLLPAGVVSSEGDFSAGDAVVIVDRAGEVVGQGLSDLSSIDLERVRGMRSDDIGRVAPELAGREVVHRDHLVIL